MTLQQSILFRPTLIVCESAEAAARDVADRMARALRDNPAITLGLATGATPRDVYRLLVQRYQRGELSFQRARFFNLDEYVGLAADHPASFAHYMRTLLFDHVDADPARTHIPDGMAEDLSAAAAGYEALITAGGGIDLQLLGIGRNGHIGFNEPGSAHDSRTRVVTLAPSTIAANAADFPQGESPPATALTMGIGTILAAGEILLLATGAAKAEAISRAICGPVGLDNPASALQRHPRVTIVCDPPAAALSV